MLNKSDTLAHIVQTESAWTLWLSTLLYTLNFNEQHIFRFIFLFLLFTNKVWFWFWSFFRISFPYKISVSQGSAFDLLFHCYVIQMFNNSFNSINTLLTFDNVKTIKTIFIVYTIQIQSLCYVRCWYIHSIYYQTCFISNLFHIN